MRTKSRELLAVGIFGRASIGDRIELLLKRGREFSPRVSLPRVIACAAALLMFAIAGSRVPRWIAFAQQPDRRSFELASVKPSNPGGGAGGGKSAAGRGSAPAFQFDHGRLNYSDNLFGMIVRAYGLAGCNGAVRRGNNCALLSGGPDWLKQERFNIQAKSPDGTPGYSWLQFLTGQAPQLQIMLQALLEDRFNLKVHSENKDLAVYILTVGKRGPNLKKGQETDQPGVLFRPSVQSNGESTIQMTVRNASMEEIADTFSDILGRPVLDRTRLNGKFDLTMEYAANNDAPGPVTELAGPDLFRAFQEEAGLRFEATRAAVQVLVIDRAEKPSEN